MCIYSTLPLSNLYSFCHTLIGDNRSTNDTLFFFFFFNIVNQLFKLSIIQLSIFGMVN